ncbi:MAG TPA: carboxylating nicotinate-nucleotide diphosphorylase, partial [Actinopolymorphaceae bacterium]
MTALSGDLTTRIVAAGLDPDRLATLVRAALDEDLGGGSDVTTLATIGPDRRDTAEFVVREAGVVAGLLVAEVTMALVSGGTAVVEGPVLEGVPVEAGTVALSVRGATADLLTGERVALNFVRHLSGVATLTHRFVAAVEGTGAIILDTRKTTPLLRALEKYAVRCGGGTNHRMTLSDMALVKDNHILAAGGIAAAYAKVRGLAGTIPVEIEVVDVAGAREAVEAGATRLLLDNMPPAELRACVEAVGDRAQLEASGGITLETVRPIAESGVDFISVGALTHSAPDLDVAMDLR